MKDKSVDNDILRIIDNYEKAHKECLEMWNKYATRTSEISKPVIHKLINMTDDGEYVRNWIKEGKNNTEDIDNEIERRI